MSNLGPLTTAYTPSGSNCASIFQTNGDVLWYGTTLSGTSSCLPTNFNSLDGFYYSPGICPSGSIYACTAGLGDGGTAATCCPSGYICRKGRGSLDAAACGSVMQTDSSFTLNVFISTDNGETVSKQTTQFYSAGNWVFANGVVIHRQSDDASWPAIDDSASSTSAASSSSSIASSSSNAASSSRSGSPNPEDTESTGLSTGAKAGIGVGVSVGVLFIIGIVVGAFMLGKRKRQAVSQIDTAQYPSDQMDPHQMDPHQMDMQQMGQYSYMDQTQGNNGVYKPTSPAELDEQRTHSELHTPHTERAELGASTPKPNYAE